MEEKKKKKNYFLRTITFLFIIYLIVYIIGISGYYEAKINKETALTNEAIKKFEQDLMEGKQVDINNYIKKEEKEYDNIFTNTGDKINNELLYVVNSGFKEAIKVIKLLFL